MNLTALASLRTFLASRETHAARVLAAYDEQDARLVARGFPPTSPWWRETLRRFYLSGRRQLVARVGRRGGKSSTLCRLAVVEALHGAHVIPPGDVGVAAFISTTGPEAANRLRTVRAILDALGVGYKPAGEGVQGVRLLDRAVEFRVHVATVAGVSGFTAIFIVCDEVAKWRDRDTGANPASEVLASVRPTMATQPNARVILSSSPYATVDAHYDACEKGDDEFQVVAQAPSWTANPTLTEAATHELEPDERVWRREYAAIPQTELEESLVTGAQLDAITRREPLELPYTPGHSYVAAMDPATRQDAWTFLVGTCRRVEVTDSSPGRLVRSVAVAREWVPRDAKVAGANGGVDPEKALAEIGALCATYHVDTVWTDQFGGDVMVALARRHGISLAEDTFNASRKIELFDNLRTRVLDRSAEVPAHATLRSDLLAVRRSITRSGPRIELLHANGRHADFAASAAILLDKHVDAPRAMGPRAVDDELFDRDRAAMAAGQRKQPYWKRAPWKTG